MNVILIKKQAQIFSTWMFFPFKELLSYKLFFSALFVYNTAGRFISHLHTGKNKQSSSDVELPMLLLWIQEAVGGGILQQTHQTVFTPT